MRELTTSIEIDAAPQRVWDVLTDFASYGEWNPFIRSIVGKPDVGTRLRVRIEPPDGRGMTLEPTVRSADPARELSWLGRLLVPGSSPGSTGSSSSRSTAAGRDSPRASASAASSSRSRARCSRRRDAASRR